MTEQRVNRVNSVWNWAKRLQKQCHRRLMGTKHYFVYQFMSGFGTENR